MTGQIAIVAIGRNEGDRLKACLESLEWAAARLVYVDSGSKDDSVAVAKSAGALVVELDPSLPFTAARARNAGFEALRRDGLPEFVQFLDGDCMLRSGYLDKALSAIRADVQLGIVTGWRAEIAPESSIYNAMCDHEWRRPAGPITACGGDMLVRSAAFEAVGGFNPNVIAAEDDEFCLRVGAAGFSLLRIPEEMCLHDADMHSFGQWWQRTIRNGHGFAQLGDLHGDHLARERLRVWVFGLALPLTFLASALVLPTLCLVVLAAYLGSYLRSYGGLRRDGLSQSRAARIAGLLTVSKFPNLIGMLTYYLRRARQRDMQIIEYK